MPEVEDIDMQYSSVTRHMREEKGRMIANGSLRCSDAVMRGKSSGTHACSGELEPEDENGLEGVVEGEVVEKDAEGKRLDKIEEAKDDPIRQPLDIVFVPRGLERTEAEVGRESPTNEVRGGRGEGVDEDEEGAEEGAPEDQRRLRDLHAGLDVIENRVARELEQRRAREGVVSTAHDPKNLEKRSAPPCRAGSCNTWPCWWPEHRQGGW